MEEKEEISLERSEQGIKEITIANQSLLKSSGETATSLKSFGEGVNDLIDYFSGLAGADAASEGGTEEGRRQRYVTKFTLKGARMGILTGNPMLAIGGMAVGAMHGENVARAENQQDREKAFSGVIKNKTDGQRLELENTLSGASDLAAQQEELEWIENTLAQKSLKTGIDENERLSITEEDKAAHGYSETLKGKLEKLNTLKNEAQAAMGRAFNEKIEPQIDAEIKFYEDNQKIILETSEKIGAYFGGKAAEDSKNRLSILWETYGNISKGGINDEELWPTLAHAGLENDVFSQQEGLGAALEGNDGIYRTGARNLLKEEGRYRLFGYDRELENSKGLRADEDNLSDLRRAAILNARGFITDKEFNEIAGVPSSTLKPPGKKSKVMQNQEGGVLVENTNVIAYQASPVQGMASSQPATPTTETTNNFNVHVNNPVVKEEADIEGVANTVAQRILRALQLSGQPGAFSLYGGPI